MKFIKFLFTYLIMLTVSLFISTNILTVSAKEDINDFYGLYELQADDSLIDKIIISEEMFSVILNNEVAPAHYSDVHHTQKFLDLVNFVNNSHLLGPAAFENEGIDDTEKYQYIQLNFYKDNVVPTFRIDVMNPDYSSNSTSLYIRHNGIVFWTFNIETSDQLVDEKQFVYEFIE